MAIIIGFHPIDVGSTPIIRSKLWQSCLQDYIRSGTDIVPKWLTKETFEGSELHLVVGSTPTSASNMCLKC